MNQLLVNWALTTISYPLLALLFIKFVKDEDKLAEDGELQDPFWYWCLNCRLYWKDSYICLCDMRTSKVGQKGSL
ncbi:hypothetical protein HanRHA438_Chr00c48g0858451 [Helianthus annuus]|nr:hypothetical protein HanRHA438_Chr00c48g0858451 [Helianthus annuus]